MLFWPAAPTVQGDTKGVAGDRLESVAACLPQSSTERPTTPRPIQVWARAVCRYFGATATAATPLFGGLEDFGTCSSPRKR